MQHDGRTVDYEPITRSRPPRKASEEKSAETEWIPNPSKSPTWTEAPDSKPIQGSEQLAQARNLDKGWNASRGHSISFAFLFLYTALAYFRPYELSPSLAWTVWLPYWLAIAMLVIFIPTQFALEGRLTARPREINILLLLVLVAIISISQAMDRGLAWSTFYSLFLKTVIVFIVMVNAMRTERRLKAMILLSLIVGCFMSASALHNYFVIGNLVEQGTRAKVDIHNMFGEPNALALHLVTVIPLAIGLLLSTRNVVKKILYVALVIVMVAGVFVTFSRGGFLALVASGSVLAWKLGRRNRVAVVVLLVVLVVAFLLLAPGGYESRLASIIDPSRDLVGSSAARKDVLIRSLWISLTSPFLGVGIGNFSIVSIHGQVSHNSYTQVASEMGLVALALYLMFILVPYRRLRQIEKENARELRPSPFYYLSVGLQASFVGCMVGTFFLSVAYEGYIYSLVGYAICLRWLYHRSSGQVAQERSGSELAGGHSIITSQVTAP